jgi:uncharacterized protein DUF5829
MIIVPALAVALLGAVESTGGTAQAETTGRQLLFYNHSYGVFDRETADAIEHSTYLRDFANFQVRTTTGTGGVRWTGRYLMGRETYVELFGVGDVPGQDGTLGSAGLGLGTDHDGDIDTVVDRLPAEGVANPLEFLQTRDFGDGVAVPWFDSVLTTETYDAFGAWAMEYRDEYFADPRGNTEPASYPGDVGRERYLSDLYRDRLMRDVTSVRIAVTQRDLDATVPLLRAGGFVVVTAHSGVVAVRGGTTIRFDVVPREQAGMKQVEFSLNRAVGYRHVEQLGHSTLVVGPGARATWTFA